MSQGSVPSTLQTIGRYEILGHLASGGMAEILLGRLGGPAGFERFVVIKRIHPHLARQKGFVEMFLDEAQILAGLRHPNIVQVQELGHHGGELFMVMEYLDGESVDSVMRRYTRRGDRLPYDLAAYITAEACAGLHAAHELRDDKGNPRNIIHRDVSPQNVVVTYDGHVKVIDFGVAAGTERRHQTEIGLFKGKLEYASPEQCLGKPLDRRADVFALGILLYELTTGTRLFRRKGELEKMRAVCEEPIRRPSRVRRDYPPELEAIVAKALRRAPDERYATANEMRRDLLDALRKLTKDIAFEHRLADAMHAAFADREDAKHSALAAIGPGTEIMNMPSTVSDEGVDLPILGEPVAPEDALDGEGDEHEVRSPWRRALPFVVGIAVFALTARGLSWRARLAHAPDVAEAADAGAVSVADAAAAAPDGAATAIALPKSAREVTVHIDSTPPNARVLVDGQDRGATPLDLKLPRGDRAAKIEIRSAGYLPVTERIVPDADEKLKVTLPPAPRGPGSPYRRFD